MIKSIPLNKLTASSRNVRRRTDPQADLELKADIASRGLLQNLVVSPVTKPRGCFAVEAGGRRLAALNALVEEGQLNAAHEVPCLVLGDGAAAAQEASLAENFQRLNMNPADECLAFRQLIEQGSDVEGIARRFGLTIRFVEGRLRLAALAPVIFEALGAGEISLDAAKAYAATPDLERQAFVFGQCAGSYMGNSPDSIRRMMTQATLSARDRRSRFVGEEAYVAAGGRIERDLFADDDAARWLDVQLVERLASEKLHAAARQMAAELGLAFVRPILDSWIGGAATEGLRRVPLQAPPLTDEEKAKVEALEAEIGEQIALLEDDQTDDDARAAAEARVRELDGQIDAIVDKPPVIDAETKATLGVFLLLDGEGQPKLDGNYYAEIADEDVSPLSSHGRDGEEPARPLPRGTVLSRRLVDELAMQRRDILSVHVAADPAFALDLVTFLMVDREAGYSFEKSGSSLRAGPPANPVLDFKTPETAATVALAKAANGLDRSWTEGASLADRFDAFRLMSEEARAAWLGHAVARTLEASAGLAGERSCAFHDHLGALLGIDVARWWRPTGANYFDRVPRSLALEALAEVGGPDLAGRYAKLKKAELSQSCERIFAGDVIAEPEVKAAALAWVPEAMRFADVSGESAANDELPPWEEEPGSASAIAADQTEVTDPESGDGEEQAGDAQSSGELDQAA